MKQRQLTDVMSEKDIRIAEIKKKRQELKNDKKEIKLEDLMKNVVYAITSIKDLVESSNNIPKENVYLINELIRTIKSKEIIVNTPEKKKLKCIIPIRDKNNVAIKYEFEWYD
jgi:hypothetical protein